MPRNAQGLYTLPAGNPVISGTTIESVWANNTMDDLAAAITDSLPRNGSAPMTGPLILNSTTQSAPKEAASKAYVDQFMAYASGMPVGSIIAFGGATPPTGFLKCDGAAVSRTTYSVLFSIIGTTYGPGDASTTFNLPDLRNEFVRGRPDSRAVGSKQAASFLSHVHTLSDPGHAHGVSIQSGGQSVGHTHPGSTSGAGAHSHSWTQPLGDNNNDNAGPPSASNGAVVVNYGMATNAVGDHTHSFTTSGESAVHTHLVSGNTANVATGLSMGVAGGDETRPQNMALDYYIKALNDGTGAANLLTGITSDDEQCISINNANPVIPQLDLHTNVAFGLAKLDASGQIPLSQLPTGVTQLLGYFDASGGQNPSQRYLAINYASGATYVVSVTGSILVYDPVTLTQSTTSVAVGSLLQYIENSTTNPTGWYYVQSSSTMVASQVAFTPTGTVQATNVQSAIAEVDGDVVANAGAITALNNALNILDGEAVKKTSSTGSALLPAGTEGQRDATPTVGAIRFSSTLVGWEGWNGTNWVPIGGGQMYGNALVKGVFYNAQTIAEDINVLAGQNGLSAGPVTVADGFSISVADGSVYTVV